MIDWPETLVTEILKERCVIFLGAGATASAENAAGQKPPTWNAFLTSATNLVADAWKKGEIESLIAGGKYLLALQGIKDNSDPGDYRGFLDRSFNIPGLRHTRIHEIILELDARIVITTNFDKVYESYCSTFPGGARAYKTIPYTSRDLADEVRSDTRVIVKAHGSIDNIGDMVFTRSRYHEAKRDYPQFYAMLQAIFLTNTIIFVGCGLEDPDILLLLEDVKVIGRHEKPHYAIALRGQHSAIFTRDLYETYRIKVLEYEPDHTALVPELENLLELVQSVRAATSTAII